VTYASAADAQDAIDNMDLNEWRGRVLKVNLARPMKNPIQPQNRASTYYLAIAAACILTIEDFSLGIRRVASTVCQTIGTKRW
jgi:hypothetical protein